MSPSFFQTRCFYLVLALVLSLAACQKKKDSSDDIVETAANPLFQLVDASKSGLQFNNKIEENFDNFFAQFNYVYNGGGVGIGDINQDGLADIYFTGNDVPNKLYLNKGNLQFEDITKKAGVEGLGGWHNGVVLADVNSDGWLDIYVCRGGWKDSDADRANLLFINQQDGTFLEKAAEYGLADIGYSLQAAFFDMDNDGDLDMYLTNRPSRFFLNYEKVLAGKAEGNDLHRDKLYRNDDGYFTEIGQQAGITKNFGYGLGIATSDFNQDGWIDIYVANDYLESDYLYLNQGNGTFNESIQDHTNHIPFYGMGVDAVDLNNDGWEDLIELEMSPEDYERSKTTMASMNPKLFSDLVDNGFHHQYMHNMLQLNRGKTQGKNVFFSEIAQYAGIAKTDWSWACLGSDFDNDGFRDIFITNGFRRDIWDKDANAKFRAFMRSPESRKMNDEQKAQYIIRLFQPNKLPNYVYRNNGDLTFENKSSSWGLQQPSFSNGMATADLDNDGDLDVVINNIAQNAFLYENTAEKSGNNYVRIQLKGSEKNPFGLGAKVTLFDGEQQQYHEFKTVRGYLSSVEPIVHFGLGKTEVIDKIQVKWLDGTATIVEKVAANQLITIDYQQKTPISTAVAKSTTFFEDKTQQIQPTFTHRENAFDDYQQQVLLPHKLSQLGPALAVGDVTGDGLDDFFIGGAAGQTGQLYSQNRQGTFQPLSNLIFQEDSAHEDVAATFLDVDDDGDLDLYVVSGGNEYPPNSKFYQDRLYLNSGEGKFTKAKGLPTIANSGGCVLPIDFDQDGDLDLFVGGRHVPGQYPKAPNSFLLENNKGKFTDVTESKAPTLANIGMVTDAVWTDLNGDKTNELIVVGEWMPITVFEWNNEQLVHHSSFIVHHSSGWWNTISATDYDGDGDMDLVVGNLGLNYKFQASVEKPFKVFANDFDKNGTQDVFLAKNYQDRVVPIRGKECSSQQLPNLKYKFPSYQQFAKADINDILGKTDDALQYEVQTFASTLLDNQNGQLVLKPLPAMAQLSTVNTILPIDVNGDTKIDLVLAGNKFESEVETTRADASVGNLLLQTDDNFRDIPPSKSGLFIPENVKAMRTIRIGLQGQTGVLVAVNDGRLRLFVNTTQSSSSKLGL